MSNKAKVVFCNHPFTQGQKNEPILITSDNIGHFIYPDFGLDHSDLNYMYLSTENITICSMEIGPGGFFDPPDYHPGDETYFILEGTITQFNPVTGQCIQVKEGEALLIPKGAMHSAYNFDEKPVKVLAVIAPKIVEEQAFPTDTNINKCIYNSEQAKDAKKSNWNVPQIYGTVKDLGQWPVNGQLLRDKQVIYHITEERKLKVICGDKRPILMKFAVSNDFMHVGEYIVPAAGVVTRHSDEIKHAGESLIFGLDCPITIYMPERRETYVLNYYEALYIPANTIYQLINYGMKTARAIFAIAEMV